MTRLSLRALLPLGAVVLLIAGCGSDTTAGVTSTSPPAAPTSGTLVAAPSPPATPGGTTSTPSKPTPTPTIPPTPVVTGSVAAVVNGHSIPISTYRVLLNLDHRSSPTTPLATIEKSVMQQVVYNELVREYAGAHGIQVTPAEVATQEKQDAAKTPGGEAAVQRLLSTRYGLTMGQYRQLIIAPYLLGQKVEARVAPAAPIKGVYTDAQAKALAERLLTQLQHGANFAALARKYSGDPGSAVQGGDLGEIQQGQTVPPFDHAAFHAPLHTYVLVHSSFGYHIVEVLSRGLSVPPGQPKGTKKVLLAHVRHILISTQASQQQIQQQQQTQQQKFLAWLQQQQKHSTVKWVAKTQAG